MFPGDHICFLDEWSVHLGLMGLRMSFFQESIDHTHKKDYVFIPRGIFYLLQSYWEESIK